MKLGVIKMRYLFLICFVGVPIVAGFAIALDNSRQFAIGAKKFPNREQKLHEIENILKQKPWEKFQGSWKKGKTLFEEKEIRITDGVMNIFLNGAVTEVEFLPELKDKAILSAYTEVRENTTYLKNNMEVKAEDGEIRLVMDKTVVSQGVEDVEDKTNVAWESYDEENDMDSDDEPGFDEMMRKMYIDIDVNKKLSERIVAKIKLPAILKELFYKNVNGIGNISAKGGIKIDKILIDSTLSENNITISNALEANKIFVRSSLGHFKMSMSQLDNLKVMRIKEDLGTSLIDIEKLNYPLDSKPQIFIKLNLGESIINLGESLGYSVQSATGLGKTTIVTQNKQGEKVDESIGFSGEKNSVIGDGSVEVNTTVGLGHLKLNLRN